MTLEPQCPVAATVALFGGKWKPSIMRQLRDGAVHFNELRRQLPQITQRMLTLQLRSLERDGVITRCQGEGNPPKINYSLTEKGRSLGPALDLLGEWGESNLAV